MTQHPLCRLCGNENKSIGIAKDSPLVIMTDQSWQKPIWPVSYTHLDVYKRQIQSLVFDSMRAPPAKVGTQMEHRVEDGISIFFDTIALTFG